MLVYTTDPKLISEISVETPFRRIMEIELRLAELPRVNYGYREFLSDIEGDPTSERVSVEWEGVYGKHWVSFENWEAADAAIKKVEAETEAVREQLNLHDELDSIYGKMIDREEYEELEEKFFLNSLKKEEMELEAKYFNKFRNN